MSAVHDRPTAAVVGSGCPASPPRTCCSARTTSRCSRPTAASAGTRTPTTWRPPTTGWSRSTPVHRAQRADLPEPAALFGELGVATQPTEMSMSIVCEGCGLEYAGARGLPACSRSASSWPTGLPADAGRGEEVPPAGGSGWWTSPVADHERARAAPGPRRADPGCLPDPAGTPTTSSGTSWSRSSSCVWSSGTGRRCSTRRCTCSGSSPTTGCSR